MPETTTAPAPSTTAPATPAQTLVSGAPAAPATPATSAPSQASSGNWADKLPDIYRTEGSLKSYSGFEGKDLVPVPKEFLEKFGSSYRENKGLIGKKLEMPSPDADPERLAVWRKTVGAPETPDGYRGEAKTVRPANVPESVFTPELEKGFLEVAHKHSLPPAALKDILDFYGGTVDSQIKAAATREAEHLQSERGKLRQMWGAEFEANEHLANRMMETMGLPIDRMPTISEYGAAMRKGADLFSEDKLVKGEAPGINGAIADKIRDISDPKSTSDLARAYRGEFEQTQPGRQKAAQDALHDLMKAAETKT